MRLAPSAIIHVDISGDRGVDCEISTDFNTSVDVATDVQQHEAVDFVENRVIATTSQNSSHWFGVCAAVGVAIAATFWAHSHVKSDALVPMRDISVDYQLLPLLY